MTLRTRAGSYPAAEVSEHDLAQSRHFRTKSCTRRCPDNAGIQLAILLSCAWACWSMLEGSGA